MPRWKALPEELDPQIREFASQLRYCRPQRTEHQRGGRPHGLQQDVLGAVSQRAAARPARGRRGARRGDGHPAAPPHDHVGAGGAGLEPGRDAARHDDGGHPHHAGPGRARRARPDGSRRPRRSRRRPLRPVLHRGRHSASGSGARVPAAGGPAGTDAPPRDAHGKGPYGGGAYVPGDDDTRRLHRPHPARHRTVPRPPPGPAVRRRAGPGRAATGAEHGGERQRRLRPEPGRHRTGQGARRPHGRAPCSPSGLSAR